MNRISGLALAALAAVVWPTSGTAGPYADELGKCLVESTSQRDRLALVRWMFSAASLHPAVEPISSVSTEELEAASKETAELMVKLLTESCRSETQEALNFEGAATIETAFTVLGQVAGREMFNSPEVAAGLSLLEKHIDTDKLEAVVSSE